MTLNQVAERYVKLALAVGQHSDYYIDAYYGPEEWQAQDRQSLSTLLKNVDILVADIEATVANKGEQLRKQFLLVQSRSVKVFIAQLSGKTLSFNDESLALYDAISPSLNEAELDITLATLDKLLPGEGELNQRMNVFSDKFVVARDKLDAVFTAAIDESRRRTKKYIELDENENFTVEYVSDKVWSAYNWYKGNSYSLIQVNTDFPIHIDRAIDLASHEGYPGHHVFNSLMEKHLVDGKGWIEYCVYPLFSPMSLLAEGSANYGIEVAFSRQERIKFEKDVLFPLAGLNAENADLYYEIQAIMQKLSYAGNMVAQHYLDGDIDKNNAIALLMKYSLTSREKSTQRLGFIEANRSYVINYNLGQDIVKRYIEQLVGDGDEEKKWQVFTELLSNPKTASMMQ
ncbi:hypothetical protein [Colwellia sp. TT2012]|uniref:hypothetical protein n=1 Tax=Colwellia sp. TT2012 TaxID=1720342 RepID=UPI00071034E2|nr:hypothetical protein [Colwellia sp. TT2012]